MRIVRCAAFAFVLAAAMAQPSFAWGLRGHEIIGDAAVARLPATLPSWLRTDDAKAEIVYLQTEEDRLKVGQSDERAWFREWSTDHYVDVDDNGRIGGSVALNALPETRDDYSKALYYGTSPIDPYSVGFLPYAILEGYEQVRTDFALERFAEDALSAAPAAQRAAAQTEVDRRRALTIHDIGIFSHFAGDGSQPLHVSVHYNGWGDYPNPDGFTTAKNTHAVYEDDFVKRYLDPSLVTPRVGAIQTFGAVPLTDIEAYLATTVGTVIPFYQLQKRGAFELNDTTSAAHKQGVDFTATRLAAAAQMLDSLILTAYVTNTTIKPYTGQ